MAVLGLSRTNIVDTLWLLFHLFSGSVFSQKCGYFRNQTSFHFCLFLIKTLWIRFSRVDAGRMPSGCALVHGFPRSRIILTFHAWSRVDINLPCSLFFSVIVMATDGPVIRQLMLDAYDLGYINGEFVFFNIYPFTDDLQFKDFTWRAVSDNSLQIKLFRDFVDLHIFD